MFSLISTRGFISTFYHFCTIEWFLGLELANFPAEVESSAVFRCVRVSSVGNSDNQYAYQTSVNIGGHLFRGILYDQGVEISHRHQLPVSNQQVNNLITNASSSSAADPDGAGASTSRGGGGGAPAPSQATTFLDPSLYHSGSLNSFMAGTQFFPPPRT